MTEETEQPAAKPSGSGIGQRRFPRYDYSIPVFVRVLLEEETFNPLRFPGRTCNISRGGLLVQIQDLPESDYRRLIQRQRMVRVHCQIPEIHSEAVFFGKIVWYDYRRSESEIVCAIGIAFEPLHDKEEKALAELIRHLENAATAPIPILQFD